MSKRRTGAGTIAALALACVFGATMLLSLATGAGVYRRVADRVERSAGERVGLTYITAKIHAADKAGMVRVGTFGGSDAVFLLQDMDGLRYETILYVYEDPETGRRSLMELFCEEGWELEPEDGQEIGEARSLTVRQQGDLLELEYTDGNGKTQREDVFLRSGEDRS